MILTFVRKWAASDYGNCPALYLVTEATGRPDRTRVRVAQGSLSPGRSATTNTVLLIQGQKIDDATRGQLQNVAADEDAVLVPAETIAHIRVSAPADLTGSDVIVESRSLLVVQGWKLDDRTRPLLPDLIDDEEAVLVPVDVIADIQLAPCSRSA